MALSRRCFIVKSDMRIMQSNTIIPKIFLRILPQSEKLAQLAQIQPSAIPCIGLHLCNEVAAIG